MIRVIITKLVIVDIITIHYNYTNQMLVQIIKNTFVYLVSMDIKDMYILTVLIKLDIYNLVLIICNAIKIKSI
jgi:hypothetical protein